MSKKTRRIMAIVLAIAMLVSLGTVAYAAEDSIEVPAGMVAYNDSLGEFYPSLEAALSDAVGGDTVILVDNDTLEGIQPDDPNEPIAPVIIPKDVKVIIPTNENWDDTEEGDNIKLNTPALENAYVTLTVPEGITLDVEGTLLVAGNQQGGIPQTGFLTGYYGAVDLEGTMNISGTVYARGSVYGSGSVDVVSGGNVFQRFEIADWRGGSASLRAYTLQGVYPFNLYEVNGLDVTATYHSGATLTGQSYIYSDQKGTGAISTIQMLGSDGLITFDDPNASVTFKHDAAGVSTAEVTGKLKTGDITVKVETQFGIDVPLTSSFGIGPFGYKQNVILKKGATFNVTNQLKILPGCTITVEPDATMNVEKGMYFYTAGSYDRSWNNAGWPPADSDIGSATLVVEESGHVTGTIGSTAENFSNITGLGELTATGKATVKEVTQSGTSVSPVEVTFQTVNLSVTATPAE